jgi:hypothetical protein
MTPDTVHAAAQMVRHSRGLLTTIEKWVAKTPPDVLATEVADLIALVRGALTDINTTLGTTPAPAAPVSAPARPTGDRPAERLPDLHP